eukprot:gene49282-8293_t
MGQLQGPALLMYDSGVFSDRDLAGLMSFGVGSKKGDPTSTGLFGLGFNSVYHLTEAPSFVTGDAYVCLDPQRRYLPGLRRADPATGLPRDPGLHSLLAKEDVTGALRDQFAPFELPCWGLSPSRCASRPKTPKGSAQAMGSPSSMGRHC